MTSEKTTRRNFLITSVAVAGSIVGSTACQQPITNTKAQDDLTSTDSKPLDKSTNAAPTQPVTMPERVLGRTAETVPIFGLGGAGKTPLSF